MHKNKKNINTLLGQIMVCVMFKASKEVVERYKLELYFSLAIFADFGCHLLLEQRKHHHYVAKTRCLVITFFVDVHVCKTHFLSRWKIVNFLLQFTFRKLRILFQEHKLWFCIVSTFIFTKFKILIHSVTVMLLTWVN